MPKSSRYPITELPGTLQRSCREAQETFLRALDEAVRIHGEATTRAAGSRSSGGPRGPGFGRVGRGKLGRYERSGSGGMMTKVLYKPMGMLVSVLGGVLAGAIFKQVWKVAFSEDDAPKATDADRSWREVLLAATLQGAIFGLVKAAVDRGTAEGTRKVTGVWPGEEGQ